MKNLRPLLIATLLATVLGTATSALSAQKLWSGLAGDTLWSSGGNWSPAGAPGLGDSVIFTNDAVAPDIFTINNRVDDGFVANSINALGYMNTNLFHFTEVTNILRVISTSSTDVAAIADDAEPYTFFVGNNRWQDNKDNTAYTTISGNSLIVSNRNANFGVQQISVTAGAHRAYLDLTTLNSFTCVVSNVHVGYNFAFVDHAWRPTGELSLAKTNSITTGKVIVSDAYQNTGARSYIHLGNVNTFNADEIRVGPHKCDGFIDTVGAVSPSVTFRNAAGTGRQVQWTLGDGFEPTDIGFFFSGQARGTMDLTGANVDAQVDRIVLGRGQRQFTPTNRAGDGNGRLIFGTGTIDVNNIDIGIQVTGPFIGGSIGRGLLQVNNDGAGPALVTVRTNITMAVQQPGSIDSNTAGQRGSEWPDIFGSVGIITVNDGSTVAVAGDITAGGGTAMITLTNGGLLDMKPTGDLIPGNVSINILINSDGFITNYGVLSVTNIVLPGSLTTFTVYASQAIAPAGVGTVGPLDVIGDLTLRGTTLIDINKSGATLSSDLVTATGPVDLGGTLKVTFPGAHADLVVGDKFTLFSAVPVNSTPTLILPPPGSGLAWNNKIFVDGSIEVVACGCGEPLTPPTLSISASPTSTTVSWPVSYTTFALRSKTNTISGNWGFVPGVVGNSVTIPFSPANQSMFFQLIQQ